MKKKMIALVLSLAMLAASGQTAAAASGLSDSAADVTETGDVSLRSSSDEAGTKEEDPLCRSYLSGELVPESVGRVRPLALMIENDLEAFKWQSGTSHASVLYEARVEGGITRLMGIFEDYKDAPKLMPCRSARPQYIYYAREFNAYYAHYGQVIYAVQLLQMPETYDIAGLPHGEGGQQYALNDAQKAFSRDHSGVTGVYTNYEKIQAFLADWDWPTDYPEGYKGHYQFAEDGEEITLADGEDAVVVLPGFTSNHARLEYDETDGLYYRSQFGETQVDHETGEQLAFKNILIQIGPSKPLDDRYGFTDPVNGGEKGEGWYITNGKAEKISWQKENWSADDPVIDTVTAAKSAFDIRKCDFNITRYYDSSGNEITLNQGKTMVEIVREDDLNKLVISGDHATDSYIVDRL